MDNFHPDHAGPSQVTYGQRQLTKTEVPANKGSYPLNISPKKPTRQGTQSLDRLLSKSSFGQDLAKIDLRRKICTKSPNPKIPMPVNPYAVPPPSKPPPYHNLATIFHPPPPSITAREMMSKIPKKGQKSLQFEPYSAQWVNRPK